MGLARQWERGALREPPPRKAPKTGLGASSRHEAKHARLGIHPGRIGPFGGAVGRAWSEGPWRERGAACGTAGPRTGTWGGLWFMRSTSGHIATPTPRRPQLHTGRLADATPSGSRCPPGPGRPCGPHSRGARACVSRGPQGRVRASGVPAGGVRASGSPQGARARVRGPAGGVRACPGACRGRVRGSRGPQGACARPGAHRGRARLSKGPQGARARVRGPAGGACSCPGAHRGARAPPGGHSPAPAPTAGRGRLSGRAAEAGVCGLRRLRGGGFSFSPKRLN